MRHDILCQWKENFTKEKKKRGYGSRWTPEHDTENDVEKSGQHGTRVNSKNRAKIGTEVVCKS